MRTRKRSYLAISGLAALALAATACGSSSPASSPSGSSPGGVSLDNGLQALNATGTPVKGGTLNLLGVGDVDYMDYNISYYTVGYNGQRMWVRGLYAYPAIPGKTVTPEPDLATAAPVISNGGLTYTVTIRSGAQWDTTPFSPVTAADAVRGLKRSCNPVQPFGGLPDFETLIKGYQAFCTGFSKAGTTVAAIKNYINNHNIAGLVASGQTVTYNLTQPASYFSDMLTLPPFNPAPAASLNFLPASAASYQNTVADGPYKVQTYVPARKIVFVRNPAWVASSDLIRKAYVNQINISETGNAVTIQQELQTNTAAASSDWDATPPTASIPGLIAQMRAGSKDFNLGPQFATNPYVVFNEVSPNNSGALAKTAVRQALSYGIDRAHLIQDVNGPVVSPPLTHVLPTGINGAQDLPANFDPYPYNPTKAKSLLASAGYPNGLSVKMLYRPSSTASVKMFQTLQADLGKVGVKVTGLGVPDADFYVKYLEVPTVAQRGVWDLALSGWGPDWYGDAATSFFKPLFFGKPSYPPSGSNFGFYNNPSVSSLVNQAASQASATTAATMWAQIDQDVMKDAPIFAITQPLWPIYHASYVHNAVYIPALQNFDATNEWLSAPTG